MKMCVSHQLQETRGTLMKMCVSHQLQEHGWRRLLM